MAEVGSHDIAGLAQVALTWLQYNSNQDREQALADLKLLQSTYSNKELFIGLHAAFGALLHAEAAERGITVQERINEVRQLFL
jgi:hypothetical protein